MEQRALCKGENDMPILHYKSAGKGSKPPFVGSLMSGLRSLVKQGSYKYMQYVKPVGQLWL